MARASPAAIAALVASTDSIAWRAARALYPVALAARHAGNASKCAALAQADAFVHVQLPPLLAAQGHITQAQLSRVMSWKLLHGKSRPGLQAFVDALADDDVIAASSKAFTLLGSGSKGLGPAIKALTVLKGVGPATATAVLAARDPIRVAFCSDDALEGIVGTRKYTEAEAIALSSACATIASALSTGAGGGAGDGGEWGADAVGRAVWAFAAVGGEWAAATAAGGGAGGAPSAKAAPSGGGRKRSRGT